MPALEILTTGRHRLCFSDYPHKSSRKTIHRPIREATNPECSGDHITFTDAASYDLLWAARGGVRREVYKVIGCNVVN